MSDFSDVDAVISGIGYLIDSIHDADSRPLDDFVTNDVVTFTATHGAHSVRVCGPVRQDGETIVVHEKHDGGYGKDVRTWAITPEGSTFWAVARGAY